MFSKEPHRKIEITLKSVFTYNRFTKKYDGDSIKLKQILDELEAYLNHVKDLKIEYGIKKDHSVEHIAQAIFSKIKKNTSMNTIKNYVNCNIEAFEISLKDIQKDLKIVFEDENGGNVEVGDKLCGRYIKGLLALLNDLILDFNEFYWQIEEFIYQRPQEMKSGRRRLFNGGEILHSSMEILKRQVPYGEISYSSVSVFLIRQSIEVSMLRALGIYSFVDKDGKELKYKLDKIYDFLKKNKKYIKIPVEISLLDKIVSWSNPYVHKAIMKYHWQILMAQKVLKPLHIPSNDGKSMSVYGIQVNKNFYDDELESKIKEFLKLKDDAEIIKIEHPDCLLTHKTF